MAKKTVVLIPGDGVGPEVANAVKRIVAAANVPILWKECEAGKQSFTRGITTGVPEETLEEILHHKVVLKGPLETPVGHGGKSANVTLRKLFETYGNIRPARILPGVKSAYSDRAVDLVVIRENVEDLYTGIEYMNTPSVAECLKIITQVGCEKIVRLAFEVARSENRKTVHCATKANIMKLSEGMLKRVFEEVAPDYPEIEAKHIIVDNCAHQLAIAPEQFEVIVTTNLNGDILSDLCSGIVGGLGVAPSANIGNEAAIFEAVHGSAPDIAGKNIVNPSSLILSTVMLLRYLNLFEEAERIENAVYKTLEDGILTADLDKAHPVSTEAFTDAIIERLGQKPAHVHHRKRNPLNLPSKTTLPTQVSAVRDVGLDVAIRVETTPEEIGKKITQIVADTPFILHGVANRGMQVYPLQKTAPDYVDLWHCRFRLKDETTSFNDADVADLLQKLGQHYAWSQVTKLLDINHKPAYAKTQGEA